MSRLSGYNVQVGNTRQIASVPDHSVEEVNRLVLEAQEKARLLLQQAQKQAKELLAASAQKAQEIEAEAEAQKETVLNQAYQAGEEAGFNKGYETGYAQAEQETVHMLQSAQTLLDGAYQAKELVLRSFKKDAGQIIQFICTKVLRKTFHTDPSLMADMIQEAIVSLRLTGRVRVVVSPETLEAVKQFGNRTEDALDNLSRLEFIPDPALGISDIFILSQEGNFSLAPGKQVEKLLMPVLKKLPISSDNIDYEALEAQAAAEDAAKAQAELQEIQLQEAVLLADGPVVADISVSDAPRAALAPEVETEVGTELKTEPDVELLPIEATAKATSPEDIPIQALPPVETQDVTGMQTMREAPLAQEALVVEEAPDTSNPPVQAFAFESFEPPEEEPEAPPSIIREEDTANANITDWSPTLDSFD